MADQIPRPRQHAGVYVSDAISQLPAKIDNGFSKYTDIRPYKQGGKAELKICKDTNLGRRVLLKMLRPDCADDHQELRRLVREARITALLQHPGTAPVYELGQTDQGQFYFSMKHIIGQTLFDIIVKLSRREPDAEQMFTLDRLLTIFMQVADALAYAHARGVIHRDVKPENIIVGQFGEVQLIDWGTAKIWGMPNEGEDDSVLQRGGTPLYMSPEQVLGHHHIDERTDVFSLGIVLYEILAQREPFRGANIRATFDNIINTTPKRPSDVSPHRTIPSRLDEICLKAIEKDPKDRYSAMSALINDVSTFRNETVLRGNA